MWIVYTAILVLGISRLGESYSKYGRTCKDIGCRSSEKCVMKEDPCSYYTRDNECGQYPTCERVSSGARTTCDGYVCPPGMMCKIDGGHPKCMEDHSVRGPPLYDTKNLNNLDTNNHQPSAPLPPSNVGGGGIYPHVQPGGTTPRPAVHRQNYNPGGGYQGGQIGSGYPGQARPGQQYPGQQYPGQQNRGQQYPGQQYPGQQYPGQQYPGSNSGGYYQQGNRANYPTNNQGGYPNTGFGTNQNNYGSYGYGYGYSNAPSQDPLTDTLKTLGLFCFFLRYMATRLFTV